MTQDPIPSTTENIKSFEVARGRRSGDLLSEPSGANNLKVGLFASGYFEYWRRLRITLSGGYWNGSWRPSARMIEYAASRLVPKAPQDNNSRTARR